MLVIRREGKRLSREEEEDGLSQLPNEVLHDILYRLKSPKAAAQTSVLGRRWVGLCRSYPVIEFDSWEADPRSWLHHSEVVEGKFRNFVAASSRKFLPCPHGLDAFKLRFKPGASSCYDGIDELMSLLIANSLSPVEFVVYIRLKYDGKDSSYMLPEGVFSTWVRTQVLKLYCCDFSKNVGIDFSPMGMLQVIRLFYVVIEQKKLHNLLANAPNLHTLKLEMVGPLKWLDVSASKLKTLKISRHRYPLRIRLTSAPLLENFDVDVHCHTVTLKYASSSSAPNLKVLNIGHEFAFGHNHINLDLHDQKLVSDHSLSAETLALVVSNKGRKQGTYGLKILSSKLRKLTLTSSSSSLLEVFVIDAPNLVTLHMRSGCGRPPWPTKFKAVSVGSDLECLVDVHPSMGGDPFSSPGARIWRKFFSAAFFQSRPMILNLQEPPIVSIPVPSDLRVASSSLPPPTIRQLGIVTPENSRKEDPRVVDCLFWICRPESVLITHCEGNVSMYSQYMCSKFVSRNLPNCPGTGDEMTWVHCLKDMKIMNDSNEMMEISEELIPFIAKQKEICFKLTWN